MSSVKIPVVFDCLGTLFSFDKAIVALRETFKSQLPPVSNGVDVAAIIIEDWFHSSQRDFTYLSMNDIYKPIGQILKTTLPRHLLTAGLRPKAALSDASTRWQQTFADDELAPITSVLPSMGARPKLRECTDILASDGRFSLTGATNGAAATTRGLFEKNLGKDGAEGGLWSVWSCDQIQVSKPAPIVYESIWQSLGQNDAAQRKGWFVAAHGWDLVAAKKAGFMTVWVQYEEMIPLEDLYGQFDIVASDLEDAAKQICQHSYSSL